MPAGSSSHRFVFNNQPLNTTISNLFYPYYISNTIKLVIKRNKNKKTDHDNIILETTTKICLGLFLLIFFLFYSLFNFVVVVFGANFVFFFMYISQQKVCNIKGVIISVNIYFIIKYIFYLFDFKWTCFCVNHSYVIPNFICLINQNIQFNYIAT